MYLANFLKYFKFIIYFVVFFLYQGGVKDSIYSLDLLDSSPSRVFPLLLNFSDIRCVFLFLHMSSLD